MPPWTIKKSALFDNAREPGVLLLLLLLLLLSSSLVLLLWFFFFGSSSLFFLFVLLLCSSSLFFFFVVLLLLYSPVSYRRPLRALLRTGALVQLCWPRSGMHLFARFMDFAAGSSRFYALRNI